MTIKEERDTAEQMISRIERKCREALQQQADSIEIHVLFDLLFGAGAAEVSTIFDFANERNSARSSLRRFILR